MPALDLIRPSVTAMRVIASVNAEFARELKLPPHIRSLGLISADSDDVTYIAADEATKQAMVEVVYGRSLYAGAAHGPSPTAGEVLIMLGGPNPAEVRAGLDAMVANIENGAAFQWANDAENTAFLAHVVSRTGSYLSSTAGITLGDPMAYLVAPPLEATYGIDAALKSADVQLVTYVPPPSETNYSAAFLTGSQSALEVKEQHKAALWGFVQQALATFCENPENLHQPAVRKVLGDNLLMAMGAMLEEAQPMVTAESISHQSYRRLLSRAREYVLENMSEPVTVLDLCNQLHVSRRTLQNAFHAILGIGPNAWLKRIRLNAVRRELISPWSQSTTVKDAAMQWGFWHLGQFATDYQQLFAEKPSLTLHQRMREWG
ncbi:HTH-type transcriptional regulator EutR [Escherichia coli]|nr:HTH-type transcriptional regulator EutR [Escherichia coli]EFN7281426.1 HTH-type transcriptional regulator EutR [Escherichia coli O11:H5]